MRGGGRERERKREIESSLNREFKEEILST